MEPMKKLLRAGQVAEKLSCSTDHIWRLNKRSGFPKPYRLGAKFTAWADDEIDSWLLTLKQKDHHETDRYT